MSTTTTYVVEGMTCGHCVAAVTDAMTTLDGVAEVSVDLSPDAPAGVTVTSTAPLNREQVAAAVEEAGGYTLVGVA